MMDTLDIGAPTASSSPPAPERPSTSQATSNTAEPSARPDPSSSKPTSSRNTRPLTHGLVISKYYIAAQNTHCFNCCLFQRSLFLWGSNFQMTEASPSSPGSQLEWHVQYMQEECQDQIYMMTWRKITCQVPQVLLNKALICGLL